LLGAARVNSTYHDAERLHLAIKVAAFESQDFGGAADVALLLVQRAKDVVALVGGTGFLQAGEARVGKLGWGRDASRSGAGSGQVAAFDALTRHHDHQAFHQILKLAHIARPAVSQQGFHRCFGKVFGTAAVSAGKFRQKEIGQGRNILGVFAQRRA